MDEVVVALVGNKCDDYANQCIDLQQASVVKKAINANIFMEISAK